MNGDLYTLAIDAYTPDTIPMARVAEYLTELARLLGEKDNVHFSGLKSGSTQLLSRVQYEAAPKVRENLQNVLSDETSVAAKAYQSINRLLCEDNADADLSCNGATVLAFPGKNVLRPPKLGPFTQDVVKEGVLVRIGGKDQTAHATLEASDGTTWSFEVTRPMAKELAAYLFGNPVRLIGQGRCFRDEQGQWQYRSLKATRFQPLDASSLADVVERIRRFPVETWNNDRDALQWQKLLRGDEEAHGW